MGNHRSGEVAPQSRGRHRAPTTSGRNLARVATAGVVLAAPAVGAGVANAENAQQFDRDAIIACESGGNPRAQNPSSSASGLYQFIDSTWRAYRGESTAARAKDASVAEQHAAAARLFAAEGYTPWNASRGCWGGKIGAGTSVKIQDVPAVESQAEVKVKPKSVAPRKAAPKHAVPVSPSKPVGAGKHTVVTGDTLSGIALRYNGDGTWSELYERNRDVVGDNPHLIYPGQVLSIGK